ncbi:LicD family protein [Levilactobacillus suantsaiihabitans]|uniref:LicD family protein n=1 Tax=Levilactobacillus suantsaiihabitans TaxID=2487722 RepID=A0A4Z0JA39_9LACO|nr:LicD family protein [Levilactobacillus suantsaiihabitans]TGD19562.1 LicD family protein [Levilactobacillus suantsaiihabitans]
MPRLIDRIHQVELGNLTQFTQLCQELDLPYFLMGGSLLGAIRHQGFIPWDDDVDVGLLRADYDRFIAQAPAALANTHYFLQTPASDQNYALSYAKLLDRNTYIEEKNNVNNARKGIFIDIFPLDRIPLETGAQREQLGKFQLLNTRLLLQLRYHLVDNPLRKLQSPLTGQQIAAATDLKNQREAVMTQYQDDVQLPQVKNLASQYAYDKEIYDVKELTDLIPVPFEQLTVQVPRNYDKILQRLYGDYLTLPPESQRTEKHLERVIMDNQVFTD